MKKLVLVMLLVSSMVVGAFAEASTDTQKEKKYSTVVVFQPLPIVLFPVMGIFNVNTTIESALGIGNIGTSLGITFGSYESMAKASGNTTKLSGGMYLFDGEIFYRFVPAAHEVKGTLEGFYIGPGVRIELDSSPNYFFVRTGPFVDFGYQWVNNNFSIDLNVGLGVYLLQLPKETIPSYYPRFMFAIGFAL